jgi:hypothetical protein
MGFIAPKINCPNCFQLIKRNLGEFDQFDKCVQSRFQLFPCNQWLSPFDYTLLIIHVVNVHKNVHKNVHNNVHNDVHKLIHVDENRPTRCWEYTLFNYWLVCFVPAFHQYSKSNKCFPIHQSFVPPFYWVCLCGTADGHRCTLARRGKNTISHWKKQIMKCFWIRKPFKIKLLTRPQKSFGLKKQFRGFQNFHFHTIS